MIKQDQQSELQANHGALQAIPDKVAPVNKEAFRMLAQEIGLNAACRKLGIPISTGKSWARRGNWELPKRKGGRPGRTLAASGETSLHPIAEALEKSHQ